MKKPTPLLLVSLFILQAALALAGPLADSLARYQREARALLERENDAEVRAYLGACLDAASQLHGREVDSPGIVAIFDDIALARNRARAKFATPPAGPALETVRAEREAFVTHLQSYLADHKLQRMALQNKLLARKYFNEQTVKNANYLEGFVNGHFALTRADPTMLSRTDGPRPLGVSPWEAIFRLEPTLALRGGPQAAIMGAAGLSYTFFPKIDATSLEPTETFRSGTIKKTGLRLGAGAASLDGKTRLLVGPGVQLHALAIWCLYQPNDRAVMLGVGTADLGKLKKALGWFE